MGEQGEGGYLTKKRKSSGEGGEAKPYAREKEGGLSPRCEIGLLKNTVSQMSRGGRRRLAGGGKGGCRSAGCRRPFPPASPPPCAAAAGRGNALASQMEEKVGGGKKGRGKKSRFACRVVGSEVDEHLQLGGEWGLVTGSSSRWQGQKRRHRRQQQQQEEEALRHPP